MRHWECQGIHPWFLSRCSPGLVAPTALYPHMPEVPSPMLQPQGTELSHSCSHHSDLAGDDSPDTTLLLYYCPRSIKTKSLPRQGSASPSGVSLGYLPSQITSKRKLQGFTGAAMESSPEKGTIKALRFNVTCIIESLQAQSCIKFPYNYVLGEKQT